MHLVDPGDTLLVPGTVVQHVGTSVKLTGIGPEESQPSHKGVCGNLKCQSGKRFFDVWPALNFSTGIRICTHNRIFVQRRRQVTANRIKQELYPFVLKGGTTYHRDDTHIHNRCTKRGMDLIFRNGVLILEKLFHQVFIVFGYCFDKVCTVFVNFVLHLGGNIDYVKGRPHVVLVPYNGAVLNKVYYTFKIGLFSNRKYNRYCIGFQHVLNLVAYREEIRSLSVHFVHKAHPGNFVVIREPPVGFRLGFHTIHGTKQENQPIQNTKGTVYLNSKIHVAGSIDDIKVIGLGLRCHLPIACREIPGTGGGSRGNGDPPFLLLLHPVHGSSTIVNLTNFVAYPGIKQDALRGGCLTGIDVRGNPYISCIF